MGKVVRNIITIFCSILFFFVLCYNIIFFNIEHLSSKSVVLDYIDDMEVSEVLENINTMDVKDSIMLQKIKTMRDKIYTGASQINIPKQVVDEYLDLDMLNDKLKDIFIKVNDNVGQEHINNDIITTEEWENLLYNMIIELKYDENIHLDDNQQHLFLEFVKDASAPVIEELNNFNLDHIDNNGLIELFINVTVVKTIGILSMLFLLTIIIILQRKHGKWLLYVAVPLALATIILLLTVGLIGPMLKGLLQSGSQYILIEQQLSTLTHSLLYSGIAMLIVTIILFIIYIYHNKKQKA